MDETGNQTGELGINPSLHPDAALLWMGLVNELERVIAEQTVIDTKNTDIGITSVEED